MNLEELVAHLLAEDSTLTRYQIAQDLGVSTSMVLAWASGSRTKCYRRIKLKLEAKYEVKLDNSVVANHKRGVKKC